MNTSDEALAHTDPADAGGEPMQHVKPPPPRGAELARARVFGALFGDAGTLGAFGRFRVLHRLGAGGMGVVYEAYDPDLSRGVALKLVSVATQDRDTALAEAKALARLSHPNVVPIYDVGLERDHVYLVMELVRGETLGRWTKHRKLVDILAVYHQAGAALAAAHHAGLVHRDFKPDNAIVGGDGRVRVVDFGLACEADDPAAGHRQPRHAAGTPRFMAPEIKAGTATTPAADQYSFAVALADALELAGISPPPRRIAAVLARGRATAAGDRFATMTELLRALSRNPERTRRRVALAGGLAIALAAAAFGLGRSTPSARCDGGPDQLEAAWSPAARSAALDRLAALGAYGASLRPVLVRALDAHAARWLHEDRAACLDRQRGAESDALADRRTACLRQGSDALAVVGDLIGRATAATLTELPLAVQAIPDPASCSNLAALASDVAPPDPRAAPRLPALARQISQASVLLGSGRFDQAFTVAGAAVAEARALGYPPILAQALLVQGTARMSLQDRGAAVPLLAEASHLAMASRMDALVIEAWARRAWTQATSDASDRSLDGLDLVESLAQRTTATAFARALLHNNLGSIALSRGARDRARGYLDQALIEARGVTGPGAIELVAIRDNLAFVTDDHDRADRLLVDAARELADKVGADHPAALEPLWHRGFVSIEDLRRVAEALAPVCTAYELHPALVDRADECWTEVGFVRADLGERDVALAAMQRARCVDCDASEAPGYAALLQGNAGAAAGLFAAGLARHPPPPDAPWWQRLAQAKLTLGLGRARRGQGDLRGARAALQSAIAVLEPIVADHPSLSDARRLGRARVELAFTLDAIAPGSPDAAATAALARAWLVRVGGSPAELERLRVH